LGWNVAYLAEHRLQIFISAVGIAEIDVHIDDEELIATIHCAVCSIEFGFNDERGLYECEYCGVEVTKPEVSDLASKYIKAVAGQFVSQGDSRDEKGLLWRLKTLFGGTRRQQALLKPSKED